MTRQAPAGEFLLAQADIGWSCWERLADGADYEPRGGTIVAMLDSVDAESGEVRRSYRTLKIVRGHLKFATLDEEQIDPATLQLPNAAVTRSLVRMLDKQIAESRGSFTSDDVDRQRLALTLMENVA